MTSHESPANDFPFAGGSASGGIRMIRADFVASMLRRFLHSFINRLEQNEFHRHKNWNRIHAASH